jgi:hypothetical protein
MLSDEDVEWAMQKYSRREVNWAGEYLVRGDDYADVKKIDNAMGIVDNFR